MASTESPLGLIEELKANVADVIRALPRLDDPAAASQRVQVIIGDENVFINRLLLSIEKILNRGLRDIALFGKTQYWEYLENLSECMPGGERIINSLKTISRSDLARGRLFARLALNENSLGSYLEALVWSRAMTARYYDQTSLFASEEYCSMLFMLLENLKSTKFTLSLADRAILSRENYFATIPLIPQESDRASLSASSSQPRLASPPASPIQITDPSGSSSSQTIVSSIDSAPSSVSASPSIPPATAASTTGSNTPISSSLSDAGTPHMGHSPSLPVPAIIEPSIAPDMTDAPLVVKKPRGKKVVKKVAHIAPPTPETPKPQHRVGSLEEGGPMQLDLSDAAISSETAGGPATAATASDHAPEPNQTFLQITPTVVDAMPSASRNEYFSTRAEVEMALNTEFEPKSHYVLLKRLSSASSSLLLSPPTESVTLNGAASFLEALEATLSDGLRPSTNLWNLFSKTLDQDPVCRSPAPSLTTATGRFRSALFTFLNQNRLKKQLEIIFSSSSLSEYYWPTSLFCNDQRVAIVLTLLQEFDAPTAAISFSLPSDSEALDSRSLYSDIASASVPTGVEPPTLHVEPPASQTDSNQPTQHEEDIINAINLVENVIQATLEQEAGTHAPPDDDPEAATKVHITSDAPIPTVESAPVISPPEAVEISETESRPSPETAPANPLGDAKPAVNQILSNPFDEPHHSSKASSTNPFDQESTKPSPAASVSNPFDEDEKPTSSSTSSNPFDREDNNPQASASSNPFDAPKDDVTPTAPTAAPAARPRASSIGNNTDSKVSRESSRTEDSRADRKSVAPDWVTQGPKTTPPQTISGQPVFDSRAKQTPTDRVATTVLFSQSPPRDLRSGIPISQASSQMPQEAVGAEARSVTFSSFEELFKAMRDSGSPGAPAESAPQPKGKNRHMPSSSSNAVTAPPTSSSSQRYATTAFPSKGGASGQFLSASVPISSSRKPLEDPFTGSPPENLLNAKIVWNYTPVSPYKKINRSNRFLMLSSSAIGPSTPDRNPDRLRTFAGFSSASSSSSSEAASDILSVKEPEVVVEAQQAVIQGQDPRATFVLDLLQKKKKFGAKTANCAECGQDLQKKGVLGKEPPYCYYTANYYCNDCHKGRMSPIPARILNLWDFKEYPVSNWAKRYIDENFKNPILDFDKISLEVTKKIPALDRVRAMREKLVLMGEYIQSCRNSSRLLNEVEGRTHLVWSTKQCSLEDLDQLRDGRLEKYISHVVDVYTVHIITCEICKGKGFYCEICNSKQLLFLFQEGVIQCPKCKNVFHSKCFERVVTCPKCERVKRIRSRSNPASEQSVFNAGTNTSSVD